MACYHPVTAYRLADGTVRFYSRGDGDELTLACKQCIGCRLERSRQWATRMMFESQMHPANSFITLTYNDDNLPNPPSLHYPHFQLFMKRLRKHFSHTRLRFFMAGEYGEKTWRPHFHAIIFGTDFPNRRFHSRLRSGFNLYTCPDLQSLWPYGFSSVADFSFESAAYVARYCVGKVTGDLAEAHYRYVCPDTGEVSQLEPEFARMSLRPGIGGSWFDKYRANSPHDYVVVRGRRCRSPAYFDRLLKRIDPMLFDDFKTERELRAYLNRSDNTDSRLAAKEIVKLAAINSLTRGDL